MCIRDSYNSSTARLYTDTGFMSRDEDLAADASDLFNFLTGYSRQEEFRKFLVAPVSIRRSLVEAIKRETALGPVSYTHLDVYKRQGRWSCRGTPVRGRGG